MGITYPQYNISEHIQNTILDILEKVEREQFPNARPGEITHRPIRPNEIYTTFTTETRHYYTSSIGTTFQKLLGASNAITVPAGIVYLVVGWIVIDASEEGNGLIRVVETIAVTTNVSAALAYTPFLIEYIESLAGTLTGGMKMCTQKATPVTTEAKYVASTNKVTFAAADAVTSMYIEYLTRDKLTIGKSSVLRIKVNGVIKHEISAWLVNKTPGHMRLTLDQIIVATENAELLFEIKSPDGGSAGAGIIYPLAYKIGPANQLDVS